VGSIASAPVRATVAALPALPAVPATPATPPVPAVSAAPVAPAASAASATSLADAPLEQGDDVAERWRTALASINERKRLLGAFLEECHFMGRAGERLVVAMDDLHRAVVEEKENRLIVSDAVRRAFGDGAVLQCAPLEAAGPGAQRPSEEQTNAMVTRALQWFGSEARPVAADERTEE
jgi:hypothetical protein